MILPINGGDWRLLKNSKKKKLWLIGNQSGKLINLVLEAVVISEVQDVLDVVEGGAKPASPLLQVSRQLLLLRRDPLSVLQQQRQLRENPGLEVPELLGFVEGEEGEAMVEEPWGDG